MFGLVEEGENDGMNKAFYTISFANCQAFVLVSIFVEFYIGYPIPNIASLVPGIFNTVLCRGKPHVARQLQGEKKSGVPYFQRTIAELFVIVNSAQNSFQLEQQDSI